ncbi:MAG TPA: helix-turn-helix domain-containing protein [Candidatus Thermoplasmatota archaeon]|nr:helix-turn-helix domain-containing protein [Candidatus Thermoplasmatota archaeon]
MGGREWCWEAAREAMALGAAPAAGLLLLGLGAWAWRRRAWLAAALFTRLSREDVRAHPARARLLDGARRAPGASTAALARALAMNEGTALYHLRVLERAGLLKSLAVGRERRWTEAGASPEARTPPARARVLDAVRGAPGASLTDVSRALGVAKSTAHHHVAALVAEGRVEARRSGRALRLYPGDRDG